MHKRSDQTVIASSTYLRSATGEPTRITREDGSYVLLDYDSALRIHREAYRAADGSVIENIECGPFPCQRAFHPQLLPRLRSDAHGVSSRRAREHPCEWSTAPRSIWSLNGGEVAGDDA